MDGQSIELYKHQQEVIDKSPNRHALFFEVGCGKSLTALKLAEKNTNNALVIVPKSIKQQWIEYIENFGEMKKFNWKIVTKEEFRRDWSKLPKYDCIIYDEFHFFGNFKSQLHKAAFNYSKKHNPKFIYGLTGTPYLSSIMSFYAYERLLGYKPEWLDYHRKYFYQVMIGNRLVPQQKSGLEKEVVRICNKIGSVVKLQDVVDMPDSIFETEYFELTKEQEEAVIEVRQSETVHIVKYTKIHQIMGGSLISDGYSKDQIFDCEKFKRLKELVKENKKIVIVCRYNNEVDRIAKEFHALVINGEVKDRGEVIKQAEAAKECVLVVQAACGVGWEIPSFKLMVFYSYDFSLVSVIQMRGRCRRINVPSSVVYLSLVNKGTIDEDILKCIMKKEDFHLALYDK